MSKNNKNDKNFCQFRRFRRSCHFQQGFSLIETLVALGILLITVALFGVAVSTLPITVTAQNQNTAYHIAARQMEEYRNTAFASLPANGSYAMSDPALNNLQGGAGAVDVADYQSNSDIKVVTVTVTWNESGTTRSAVLETLMSQDGLNP